MSSSRTPYDRIGGRPVVRQLVDRFYDRMEQDPAYRELRHMHAADLAPMRESLTDFLAAWMGGPRDWFDKRPGACIMSAHAALKGMNQEVGRQWIAAMREAADEVLPDDGEFRNSMLDAMSRMSRSMSMRGEAGASQA